MAKSLEAIIFLIVALCGACAFASEATESGAHAAGGSFSPDMLEKITDNYIQRTERAQHLRKELHDQLNLLSQLNTMTDHGASSEKFMFFALLGHVRRTFLELDEILDGFVPTVADAHEVVHNFKLVSQAGGEDDEDDEAGLESSQQQAAAAPRQARSKKDFDWFKRNYNPYQGSNHYNKVPVIRTGK
jgi:hypothetical protein